MATTGEVAKLLSLSRTSIQSYSRRFGQFLSASANPEPGQRREFTDQDVRVLYAAKGFLDQGASYAEAVASLMVVPDFQELEAPPEAPKPVEETALVPITTYQAVEQERDRLIADYKEAQARVAELERRLGLLEGHIGQSFGNKVRRFFGRKVSLP